MRTYKLIFPIAAAIALTGSVASAQVVTSGGEVTKLTQKNLVDRMIVADSLEVGMAQLAVERTKTAAVRDLANLLINDHKTHLDSLHAFAAKPDIGREAIPGDPESQKTIRAFAQLRSAPDSTFDKLFVSAQIESHERAIDALKKNKSVATSPEVQKDIDGAITVLEAHLGRAKGVASVLNTPK
jgi:putative membrane protein